MLIKEFFKLINIYMSVIEYKVCDRCGSKLNGITVVSEFNTENPDNKTFRGHLCYNCLKDIAKILKIGYL